MTDLIQTFHEFNNIQSLNNYQYTYLFQKLYLDISR